MSKTFGSIVLLAGLTFGLGGCATAPSSEQAKEVLANDAQSAIGRFKAQDPGFETFLNNGYAHVIFPDVGKGGLGVGGSFGRGIVYEQGKMIGYASLEQATIGLQAGGQTFSELIVFENKAALDRFTNNRLEFAANASAVAIKSGASATAKYTNGVAIFTRANGGLMFEASVGGQRFTFKPTSDSHASSASSSSSSGESSQSTQTTTTIETRSEPASATVAPTTRPAGGQ